MRALFTTLTRVAASDGTVLVRGETGSGKELVARAIHEASLRRSAPFVVVDCAAQADVERAIEAARGGTVLLDEIAELPLERQATLLRLVEQRANDVRFIASTHRNLSDFVARGWFREDLYFRLAVLPVVVPPLRERRHDIELLARQFLGASSALLVPAFLAQLVAHAWPGNVRELRNALERARALGVEHAFAGEDLAPVSLPPSLLDVPHREFRERWTDLGEKAYLAWQLRRYARNVSKVSREISLARTYTHKLIKKHGL
jgi:DNA-binding NtrC family response regulator